MRPLVPKVPADLCAPCSPVVPWGPWAPCGPRRSYRTNQSQPERERVPFGSHDPRDAIMDAADERADRPLDRSFLNICHQSKSLPLSLSVQPSRTSFPNVPRSANPRLSWPCASLWGRWGLSTQKACSSVCRAGPHGRQSVTWCCDHPSGPDKELPGGLLLTMQLLEEQPEISVYKKPVDRGARGFRLPRPDTGAGRQARQRDKELQAQGF
jgi:hypothetical protein